VNLAIVGRLAARRGWLVVVGLLLGAAAGLGLAAVATPTYGAVTRVKVQPARPADLGQTQAIREIMRSYMRDIRTYDMAAAVRQRLCESADEGARAMCDTLDDGAIRGMIEVSADENVFEIRVKARSADPATAVKVSEQTAHAFVDRRDKANRELDLRERILVEVREGPQPNLDSPRRKLYAAAMAAVGAALGALVALLLEYAERSSIVDGRDAARVAGAPVLGRVPGRGRGRRAGRRLSDMARGATSWLARAAPHAVPVVLFSVLGAAVGLAFSRIQPTEYVARTRIAVEPALGSDWGQSLAIREITRGFGEDIRTREMAGMVNERLQLDLPIGALLDKVHVAPEVDVYEIVVEAFDPSADVASVISEGWARLFVERRSAANLALDQRDRILTRLRDRTEVEVWAPKTMTNVLAGAMVGAIAGAASAYALARLRSSFVRSTDQAAVVTRSTVLATIPPDPSRAAWRQR
jgi:capsular polysaccharide biosynthesis protein